MRSIRSGLMVVGALLFVVSAGAEASEELHDAIADYVGRNHEIARTVYATPAFMFDADAPDPADEPEAGANEDDGWDFELSLYGKDLLGLVGGIDSLALRFEGATGDWGFIFDIEGISLDDDHIKLKRDGRIPLSATADVEIDMFHVFGAAKWRFLDVSTGESSAGESAATSPGLSGELYGGFRYGSIETDVGISAKRLGLKDSWKDNWLEPVIGLRFRWVMGKVVSVGARADAGGFGWGDMPEQDLNIVVGFDFRLAEWISLRVGYHWHHFEYEQQSKDEFGVKLDYGVPWLALTFHF